MPGRSTQSLGISVNERGSRFGLAVFIIVIGAVLWFAPSIISLLAILAWSFISIGRRSIDGYAKVGVGAVAGGLGAWSIYSTQSMLRETKLVPYAQFMYEAHLFWSQVFVATAILLIVCGIWHLFRRQRRSR